MALFNLGKKKEEVKEPTCACNAPVEEAKEESCCCCGGESSDTENCGCVDASTGIQNIKVLGAGCKSKKAVEAAGIEVEVEYVTDMEKVMTYGIMSMPGLVVNEKVVSVGKVLKPADIEKLFHKLGF